MATRIETAYTRRTRYDSSADRFNIKRPAVPAHVFTAERDLAHHNDGDHLALFLIVQDGGFHYHTRTMGFSYE
jgi:hypothetical protein